MSLNFSDYVRLKIPEGDVTKITRQSDGAVLWKKGYVNLVPLSTTTDGKTIFNGTGYKDNTRLNSSAVEAGQTGYAVCGYIPAKPGNVVRLKGMTWDSSTNTGGYFWTFDSSFAGLKYKRPNGGGSSDITFESEGNGVIAFRISTNIKTCAYIRLSAYGSGADMIITVNEEI